MTATLFITNSLKHMQTENPSTLLSKEFNPLMSLRLFSHALNEEFLVPLFIIQICSVFAAKKACISAFEPKNRFNYLV